ncbi:4728_t:CDS:1, partial [Scutellospora calospora]
NLKNEAEVTEISHSTTPNPGQEPNMESDAASTTVSSWSERMDLELSMGGDLTDTREEATNTLNNKQFA